MTDSVVVIGAGHAAGQVAATLRQKQFPGAVLLVGDEPYPPYQRPPLSKKYLAGDLPAERLYVRPESFYEEAHIDLCLNTHIDTIDRKEKRVRSSNGDSYAYDKLVLATGSRVRRLPLAGTELEGVHYLRTIKDVDAIHREFATGNNLVVIGAGYIGLEVAAVCRQRGLQVSVVEMADRVMSRVVSEQVSEFYEQQHESHGVKLMTATGVAEIVGGDGRVEKVITDDGRSIAADFVVVGIGIEPNADLAAAAGLDVDDGIIVDDRCRTSDPSIFAVGDCSSHPSDIYGRRVRLESVQNAVEQAKTAAINICGDDLPYAQVPWFWSDQYDLKLQIAGLSQGFDQAILRGDPASKSFACLYLKDRVLLAVDAVNAPRDFLQSKALIAAGAVIDPRRIADASVALKELY